MAVVEASAIGKAMTRLVAKEVWRMSRQMIPTSPKSARNAAIVIGNSEASPPGSGRATSEPRSGATFPESSRLPVDSSRNGLKMPAMIDQSVPTRKLIR